MVRELTKSSLSFFWALSLLGARQAAALARAEQDGDTDLFAPLAQAAASRLDGPTAEVYRSLDSFGSRMVDFAFEPWNTVQTGSWPHAWPGKGMAGQVFSAVNPIRWMKPGVWMKPGEWMRPPGDCGCQHTSPDATHSDMHAASEDAWGPMHG